MTEGPYKLPEGWRWVRLGEVCLPTERRDPSKEPDMPFMYIDISSIDPEKGQIVSPKQLKGAQAPSRARKAVRAYDVIFATTRPYLKNIALVPSELDDQVCSTGFCVLRANVELSDPKYLFYLCRSDLVLDQVCTARMRGASYPAVTDDDVLKVLLPLPPLDEQRRIVARIEALMERIREAKRLRQEAKADAERLMQAALAEVFPRPGTEPPPGWRWVRLGEVASKPQYGYTKSASFQPVGPKFIRITDITSGEIDWDSVPYCECDAKTLDKYRLHPGDILFARSGSVGATILIRDTPYDGVFASYLIRVQLREQVLPEFVGQVLKAPICQRQFIPQGAAQKNINAKLIENILIPLPPLEEQRRIVAYLQAVLEKVKALKDAQAQTDEDLRRLEQAILEKAFKGEL